MHSLVFEQEDCEVFQESV